MIDKNIAARRATKIVAGLERLSRQDAFLILTLAQTVVLAEMKAADRTPALGLMQGIVRAAMREHEAAGRSK